MCKNQCDGCWNRRIEYPNNCKAFVIKPEGECWGKMTQEQYNEAEKAIKKDEER